MIIFPSYFCHHSAQRGPSVCCSFVVFFIPFVIPLFDRSWRVSHQRCTLASIYCRFSSHKWAKRKTLSAVELQRWMLLFWFKITLTVSDALPYLCAWFKQLPSVYNILAIPPGRTSCPKVFILIRKHVTIIFAHS